MTLSFKQLLVLIGLTLWPLRSQAGDFTLLFAGGAAGDDASPTLARLHERLKSIDPQRGVVVFTGNYSEREFPAEGRAGRAEAERAVLAHVTATRDFVARGGKVYFLPGHRDFAVEGTAAVRRLKKFLNDAYATDFDVMPEASCGDPTLLDLTDDLGLLLVNSQWWMEDWDLDPLANEGCEVKTREAFGLFARDAFNEYRTRRMIVASHHPLRSYGELGGEFSVRAHLTPAPILGSFAVLARKAGLVPQYRDYPLVRTWVDALTLEAERYGAFVFASGHDASLQYLKVGQQTQLVSGSSGRTAEPTVPADEGEFAAASPGWAELVIAPSGGGEVKLIAGHDARVLFEAKVPEVAPFATHSAAPPASLPASPVRVAFGKKASPRLGPVMKVLIGSFYSDAYALELPYEVLDLSTEEGGLTPYKTGGSFQTNSLGLRDAKGGAWSMRATKKDSSRFLGNKQDGSAEGETVSHGFTAGHPEAALAVARLALAVGVLHAEPRLMYLPDQPGLGKTRGYISDELVLLERNPKDLEEGVLPESLAGKPSPAGPTRFRTTGQMLEKLREKPATHRLDQEAMLRARLLDLFVGDWDRHQGQWRFAAIPNPDGTRTYLPIPRDRDQAFAHYDGVALALARTSALQPRELQPFTGDYSNLKWLAYSARDLDPIWLNQLPRDRWLAIAAEVKAALTDPVIDEAMATWHPETYALDGARIAAALKVRRDKLVEVADQFFALVNENADVLGSIGDDRFDLWFEDRGAVRLAVRAAAGGEAWFDRSFEADQTAQLRIYALEGDDLLVVHGSPHPAIDIRFVGGEGQDRVTLANRRARVRAPAIRLYDSEQGAQLDPRLEVTDQRSKLAYLNQYDRIENHDPDYGVFIPGLRANLDEGLLLGTRYTHLNQGYKKRPFAARHELLANFATATLGAGLEYRAVFPQSADLLDQQLELSWRAPTNTRNFFGYTNEVVDRGEPLDFFRVRQASYEGSYGLFYGFSGGGSRAGAQLVTQAIVTEPTPGRFVTQSPDVTADMLGARYFAGTRLSAMTHTFDSLLRPTRGVGLSGSIEARIDLLKGNQLSTNYQVSAAVAIPIDRQRRFVLVSRASLEGIVGEHAFYFSPTLGDTELRSYHSDQLAGEVALAQTTDLRIDVFRSATAMLGAGGVSLSVDHGRVFGPSISSDTWHLSLGGSVWWAVMDNLILSAGYYRGLDGSSRFSLMIGPLFAVPVI